MSTVSQECRCLEIRGTVQGVGFRPFVYRLATRHGLCGWVCNQPSGVQIAVEGSSNAIEQFLRELECESPPLARIESIESSLGITTGMSGFQIRESSITHEEIGCVPADTATCVDCLGELIDPADRRYRYPFVNCTNCGPRYTIIESMPYDRLRTTMASFSMCPECLAEYHNPGSRRFHAQPNACPACGPKLSLTNSQGEAIDGGNPIAALAAKLAKGSIAAVKGLGGFHLAVDARNEEAVRQLRLRKHREEKPFAIMVQDLEAARSLCFLDETEAELLANQKSPIVLLRRRDECPVAESVAPGRRELGVILAYTPLHHLLLADMEAITNDVAVLVMTSGNLTEEPIAYKNDDAIDRLKTLADVFLIHDREIHCRSEDSVTRVIGGAEAVIRRSRGYAPEPIPLPFELEQPVLAVGPHLKNTFCLGIGRNAYLSPHVGDLDNYLAYRSFRDGIRHFQNLFDVAPAVIAHDLHPEYLSTKYAQEQEDALLIGVQHHHAHVASVLAEHGLKERVIGVAFDGTGFGTDGSIWGAEFLIADCESFERAAHLKYVPLPGGERAIKEPWRIAAVFLSQSFGEDLPWQDWAFTKDWLRPQWATIQKMIAADLNCPRASSMGRLFDAVSSLVTGRRKATYEGQTAAELEMLVDAEETDGCYQFLVEEGMPLIIDPAPVIREVVYDLLHDVPGGIVSARFHSAVANLILEVCCLIRGRTGLNSVALSGGVFQNRTLLTRSLGLFRDAGFQVLTNRRVPANDGGIALGQLAVAAAKLGGL